MNPSRNSPSKAREAGPALPLVERGPAVSRLRRLVKRAVDGDGALSRGERIVVAVSGGPDSSALLDVLARLAPRRAWQLLCVHVDHGLRPESAAEADVVAALAKRCKVAFRAIRAELPDHGSPQDRARRGRYTALEAVARDFDATAIATGHTADDQAETVLMRVLSGAPPASLTAMAMRRGSLSRPMLAAWHADTVAYCKELGIEAIDDPSNRDPRYLRTRVRHDLLPALETVYPAARRRLVALATSQREVLREGLLNAPREKPVGNHSDTASGQLSGPPGSAETSC